MSAHSETPTPAHVPLETQVGGHAGVQTSEDGSLLFKPALPLELEFYEHLNGGDGKEFDILREYIPKFFGILKPQGQEKGGEVIPVEGEKDEFLENLSHTFVKPNILDVKLGTELYDESASAEKRERMIKTAKDTTSFETGVRLTGFQVYDNALGKAVNTPKSYGKSIKKEDLPDGIARFFPLSTDSTSGSGLPKQTLLPLLRSISSDIKRIRDAFSSLEVRMVGGSILVIYEADWDKASEGLKKLEAGEFDEEEEESDDEEEIKVKKVGKPYSVKMIDFAHTRLVPGKGKDKGVLLGMQTVLDLIDGRIQDIETL